MIDAQIARSDETAIDRIDPFFSSGALETLFWHPRYAADPDLLLHVPLLFWLTGALRPRRAAVLHTREGTAFFAICQVLDKLDIDARCFGYDAWNDDENAPPPELTVHAAQIYPDLAVLRAVKSPMSFGKALKMRPVDLLFVDLRGLEENDDLSADLADWRGRVAPGGILVLFGLGANLSSKQIAALGDLKDAIDFDTGLGMRILPGRDEDVPAIRALSQASSDGILQGAVNRLFCRFGQTFESQYYAKTYGQQVAEFAKQSMSATQEIQNLQNAFEHRSASLAKVQSILFDTREQAEALNTLSERVKHQHVEIARLTDAKRTAQKAANTARSETEAERQTRFRETAVLTRQLDDVAARIARLDDARQKAEHECANAMERMTQNSKDWQARIAQLDRDRKTADRRVADARDRADKERKSHSQRIAALTAELNFAQAQNKDLLEQVERLVDSKSWRITAPLRKFSYMLNGGRR